MRRLDQGPRNEHRRAPDPGHCNQARFALGVQASSRSVTSISLLFSKLHPPISPGLILAIRQDICNKEGLSHYSGSFFSSRPSDPEHAIGVLP
ncbi:hypothetical protein PHLCEN_2v13637 [Hermanssonia centrifuga]|uniref:Uncharacterized protein n=1 Tax=Hermanssonia centrifuga TaxID=98765 RepID=A0A2R6NDU1_9APHY|nr:hypothetical protein PHLCEN_2v13637 [Hermanssonia centrifuga]